MKHEDLLCPDCGSYITLEGDFCDSCGFYLGREFLLITNGKIKNDKLINDRYVVLDDVESLVKDTQSNKKSFSSQPVNDNSLLETYLKLSKNDSIPRVYDAFSIDKYDYIVLKLNKDKYGQDFRTIKEAWLEITDKEKLQIIRDLALLFELFESENVTSTLFNTNNMYVDENIVIHFKKLYMDIQEVNLKNLGILFDELIFPLNTEYEEYLKYEIGTIVRDLIDGKIESIKELINMLDNILEKPRVNINHFASTDMGKKRKNNEDNFYAATFDFKEDGINKTSTERKGLYIVCDGMGGHESGEIASSIAISAIRKTVLPTMFFSLSFDDIRCLIEESIVKQANEEIFRLNETQNRQLEKRMGTTVVMAMVIDNKVYTAHVGDSRIYLVSKTKIEQISEDHNIAMKNYRDGYSSLEDALDNAKTSWGKILTQALGPKSSDYVSPEINTLNLKEDSYIILCSDGLTDMLNVDQIELIVRTNWNNSKRVVERLIETANENGGKDNITVVASLIKLMPPILPQVDYEEIFYETEINVNDEMIEMTESPKESTDGINVELTDE